MEAGFWIVVVVMLCVTSSLNEGIQRQKDVDRQVEQQRVMVKYIPYEKSNRYEDSYLKHLKDTEREGNE